MDTPDDIVYNGFSPFQREKTMCLAIPAQITRLDESGTGIVSHLGNEVRTNFALLPEARIGDWVIIHAGFAISRLTPGEARETLRLFKEMEKAGR